MFKLIILSIFAAIAAAGPSFSMDFGNCPAGVNVGQCFAEAHAAARPCYAKYGQKPELQRCVSDPKVQTAVNDWKTSSSAWHQVFSDCMNENSRVKRQMPSQDFDDSDECYANVKTLMDKCNNQALQCDKYAKCYNRDAVAKGRADTNAKQQVMKQTIDSCKSG